MTQDELEKILEMREAYDYERISDYKLINEKEEKTKDKKENVGSVVYMWDSKKKKYVPVGTTKEVLK